MWGRISLGKFLVAELNIQYPVKSFAPYLGGRRGRVPSDSLRKFLQEVNLYNLFKPLHTYLNHSNSLSSIQFPLGVVSQKQCSNSRQNNASSGISSAVSIPLSIHRDGSSSESRNTACTSISCQSHANLECHVCSLEFQAGIAQAVS